MVRRIILEKNDTPPKIESINITPTWAEVMLIYTRLAESGEKSAARSLRPEMARVAAAAQALQEILPTLSEEQSATIAKVMAAELSKMGY